GEVSCHPGRVGPGRLHRPVRGGGRRRGGVRTAVRAGPGPRVGPAVCVLLPARHRPTGGPLMGASVLTAVLLLAPAQEGADELLKNAVTALNAGDLKAALAWTDKALEREPKRADAHLLRAVVHEHLGEYAAAVAGCDRCLELDPKFA